MISPPTRFRTAGSAAAPSTMKARTPDLDAFPLGELLKHGPKRKVAPGRGHGLADVGSLPPARGNTAGDLRVTMTVTSF